LHFTAEPVEWRLQDSNGGNKGRCRRCRRCRSNSPGGTKKYNIVICLEGGLRAETRQVELEGWVWEEEDCSNMA